jgi:hypothetical protein
MLPDFLALLFSIPLAWAEPEYPRADSFHGTYLVQAMECMSAAGKPVAWAELEPEGQLPNQLKFQELEARMFFKGNGFTWEWLANYTGRLEGMGPDGGRRGVLTLGRVSVKQSDSIPRQIPIRWSQDPLEPRVRGLPTGLSTLLREQDRKKVPLLGFESRYRTNAQGDIRIEAPARISVSGGASCWLVLKRQGGSGLAPAPTK